MAGTILAGILVAPLAACTLPATRSAVGPPDLMIPDLPAQSCGAADLSATLGSHFTTLADADLPGALRVIWPGQEVTGEVDARRLNAQVLADGTLVRLSCG